jgi:uncharacterized protein (TIGR03663 family)
MVKDQRTLRVVCVCLLLLVGAGAFLFRVPKLTLRPMHTDEAVHADKLRILLEENLYEYNAHEYHGPTPYYVSLPILWAMGVKEYRDIPDEFPLRIVPVLFGTGLILLLLLFRDAMGQRAAVCAGLLTAVSPVMVFYSRYYIQEMLLVFFTFGAIVAGWRYTRSQRFGWALAAGACLGLMHATKETCVLAYGSLVGAWICTALWSRWLEGRRFELRSYFRNLHLVGAIKVAAVVSILCLTGFWSNPKATIESVMTYVVYVQRALTGNSSTNGANLHDHPWYYYLQLLLFFKNDPKFWWSEALVVGLSLVGMVKALKRQVACEANFYLLRFLAFYTILMTIVYSIIPYKTPWCLLGFYHGMILLAGVGAVAIYRRLPRWWIKVPVVALFLVGVGHLGVQAYRANFRFPADQRNPWVYGHTSTPFLKLVKRMNELAAVYPGGYDTLMIQAMAPGSDYWPLPWYLRRFEIKGFYGELWPPPYGPVVIAGEAYTEELDQRLGDAYVRESHGLRPDVLLSVYIERGLWEKFLKTRGTGGTGGK